jgi:hypothetical protein
MSFRACYIVNYVDTIALLKFSRKFCFMRGDIVNILTK